MNESASLRQFYVYITGQIQKINHSLQQHGIQLQKINDINTNLKRQNRKYEQLQKKMKLMQVYQGQNFKNNQRIFNTYNSYEMLQRKVQQLSDTQLTILLSNNNSNKVQERDNDKLVFLQARLKDIQLQVQRNQEKKLISNKFRKPGSPRLINSQSTKDISIDFDNCLNRKQIKKIEKKLQEFVTQRIKKIQLKLNTLSNENMNNKREAQDYQIFDNYQNGLTFKESRTKQQGQNKESKFRRHIDNYYSQPTQTQSLSINNKGNHKMQQRSSKKSIKSKSKLKGKKKSKSISNDKISLNSVKEYLKLNNKK